MIVFRKLEMSPKGMWYLEKWENSGFIHIILHKCYSFSKIMKIAREDWTVLSSPQANGWSNESLYKFLWCGPYLCPISTFGIRDKSFNTYKDQFPNKVTNYPRTSMFLLLLHQIHPCRDFLENRYNDSVKISKYYLQRNFFSKIVIFFLVKSEFFDNVFCFFLLNFIQILRKAILTKL